MARHELAQLNIATMKEPLDSPVMADFVANLDRINALAEGSPGFVWRLKTEEGDATGVTHPFGGQAIVNMSVWQSIEDLNQYVYRSAHVEIMRRRREWFERMDEAFMVLWWVKQGHRPTLAEARRHLDLLREHGPTPGAFTFRANFPAPDAQAHDDSFISGDECPAT